MTVVGSGRGVLVTGATSGLGRAVALRFATEGVPVAMIGRSEADLAQVATEVRSRGARAVTLHAGLSATESLSGLVDRAASELGSIGALVNSAGTDVPGPAEELSLDDWNRVVLSTSQRPSRSRAPSCPACVLMGVG